MTDQEKLVISALCLAHNEFVKLPTQHPDDAREWTDAIHRAQQIIMSRVAVRGNPEIFINVSKPPPPDKMPEPHRRGG